MPSHCDRSRAFHTRGYSFALRCLLLILAWQGPVPWCHCHDALADSSSGVSPWLAKHLQTYHPRIDPIAPLGWHLHARLPGFPSDDPDEPTQPEQERLPITNCVDSLTASFARAAIERFTPLPCLDQFQPGGLFCAGNAGEFSSHFYDAFAPHLALPMRLCVSRN